MPRLLHTSDVHVGEAGRDSIEALGKVVDIALRDDVDVVLFAGDTFDSVRVSQDVCDAVRSQLQRLTMPVIVLPGNHDALVEGNAWDRITLPSNVRLIRDPDGETIGLDALDMEVWGRPHLSYYDDVAPLADVPKADGAAWHVAIGHGHVVRRDEDLIRSYLIHPEQIASCGRHYVALGHWDFAADVSRGGVVANYSGSPSRYGQATLVDLNRTNGTSTIRVTMANV